MTYASFSGSEDDDEETTIAADTATMLTVSYHDEPRLPLHAVKEDVEAEEAEEAAMGLHISTRSGFSSARSAICSIPQPSSLGINGMYGSSSSIPVMKESSSHSELRLNSSLRSGGRGSDPEIAKNLKKKHSDNHHGLSRSVDVLEDDHQFDTSKYSSAGSSVNGSCNDIVSHRNYNCEVDLTDGIPNYVDYNSDERDNLNRSPCSDNSPLSHSLASSVASNMSIDDTSSSRTDTSSFTDTQDTVIAIVQKNSNMRPSQKNVINSSNSNKSAKPSSLKTRQISGQKTSDVNNQCYLDNRTKKPGMSPRLDNNTAGYTRACRNSPRNPEKSCRDDAKRSVKPPTHDRRACRNSGNLASTVSSRSKTVHDPPKKPRHETKLDHQRDYKPVDYKYGSLERKKTDKSSSSKEDSYETSTLGRRKKKVEKEVRIDPQSWLSNDSGREAEKYGTLGRRKKIREAGDGREETQGSLTKENKDTLDTYATLPRRKAREMTARWREQNLCAANDHQATVPHINVYDDNPPPTRPLRRSRSIGKGETSRYSTGPNPYSNGPNPRNSANFIRSSPRVSSARTTNGPTAHHGPLVSPRPAMATQTPRKERTIICLETAIQTALTGVDVASAMQAQAKLRTLEDPLGTQRPKIEIIRDFPLPPPKPQPTRCNAQVQVSPLACEHFLRNFYSFNSGYNRKISNIHVKLALKYCY